MKTANPAMGSAAESLYSFEGLETDSNLANPTNLINPRPSLTPGANPQNSREERLMDKAYQQGFQQAKRIYEDEDLYGLNILRSRLKQIRKKKIKSGEVDPITKEERKWRLGL